MKKLLTAIVAVGIAAASLVTLAPAQAAGKTLTYGTITDITDWRASSGSSAHVAMYYLAIYDSLLTQKADGSMTAGLADKWSYDKTGTVLTLHLRSGVKFTDGQAFNAAAVVKAMNAYKTGASVDAGTQTGGIVSVTAKGTDTVIIKLSYADPAFIMYLGKGLGYVASPASDPNDKSNPIGAGPYIYDKANSVAGSSYVFKANPTYWNKANRKYDSLIVKYMPSPAAAVNAVKAGQVDVMAIQDNTAIAGLKSAGFNVAVQQLNWRGINFIDKAGRMGSPIKNLKVRQAINYAIDRKAMLDLVQLGAGEVTQQVFAKYNVGYVASLENTYTYNVDKAKALLTEAGYPNGFTIDMPQNNALPAVAFNFLSDQLAKVGITIKWTGYAGADWAAAVQAPKFPMSHGGLERSTNDWALVRFLIARDAAWNPSGYGDATSDKLIATMQAAKTPAAYKAAAQAINKYVTAQAWYAPLYTQDVYVVYTSNVSLKAHAGNVVPFLTDISPK